ncbi:hypothetical protein EDB80DRAFT_682636 [Ilyonectria destructans]|nr:hypothetical protein EDB80DRAFT_682636 [Ilyonectria destructans]
MTNADSNHSLPHDQYMEDVEHFGVTPAELADRVDRMTDGGYDSDDGDHSSDGDYVDDEEDEDDDSQLSFISVEDDNVSEQDGSDNDGDDDHTEELDYENMVELASYLHIRESPMPTTYQEALSDPRGLNHEQKLDRPSLKRPRSDTPSTAPGKRHKHNVTLREETAQLNRNVAECVDIPGSYGPLTKLRQLVNQTREMMNNLHERAAEREELVAMIANRPEWDQTIIANIYERLKNLEDVPVTVEFDIADIQDRLTALEANHAILGRAIIDTANRVDGLSRLVNVVVGIDSDM